MEVLEQIVPAGRTTIGSEKNYAEKQLLDSYMTTDPSEVYDCETCNSCGSGDCASCCSSGDD